MRLSAVIFLLFYSEILLTKVNSSKCISENIQDCRVRVTNQVIIPIFLLYTQVGSPAVHLRLASCTSWVKRWSEAMDFLQTIFKTNISLSRINLNPSPPSQRSQLNFPRGYVPAIPITLRHLFLGAFKLHVAINFRARKFTK